MIHHSKPTISKKEIEAAVAVLKSGLIAQGPVVQKFEQAFRSFFGLPYACAVNSGTSALHLAMLALKIKPADEVIIPSYACTAVLNAVNYVGAKPRIADINPDDFNISIDSVKNKLNKRTKAIIAVHMFGVPADMDGLLNLGVPVIEDCALSVGAKYNNKPIGSFGAVSIFSFYATKMMTTMEGGMILTKRRNIHNFVLDARDYDNKVTYKLRYNYKMSDVAASLGLSQLKSLSQFISRRQKIAAMYNKGLSGLGLQLPVSCRNKDNVYFRYIVRTGRNLDGLINALGRLGIEAKRPIFKPLHNYLGLNNKDYPATAEVYISALSLPIYPSLKDSEVKFIIEKARYILLKTKN